MANVYAGENMKIDILYMYILVFVYVVGIRERPAFES
jgi:hypothetical protein